MKNGQHNNDSEQCVTVFYFLVYYSLYGKEKNKLPTNLKMMQGKGGDDKDDEKKKGPENMKQQLFSQIITVILVIVVVVTLFSLNDANKDEIEIVALSRVAQDIQSGQVERINVNQTELSVTYVTEGDAEPVVRKAKKEDGTALTDSLVNLGVSAQSLTSIEITVEQPSGFWFYFDRFAIFLPILVILLIFFFSFVVQKGPAVAQCRPFRSVIAALNFIDPKDPTNKITFKDVAGAEEAKQELVELVDFLKNPKKFHKIGAEIPKGALLMGAPGTGKTLLARAVAGEAEVPFLFVSASEFVEMFVGVGASRVRDLFKLAKKEAPAIIFIDEIDAIGRVRGGGTGGGNDEREQTLNQILVEMDGFEKTESVIVMAATNRAEVLDPALLRPGRFDRRVVIDLPDKPAREEILEIHARKKKMGDDTKLEEIAKRTPGFSGADLYSVMNEGAIFAARDNRKKVTQHDLVQAIEKVAMGPERKSKAITAEQKELTAYHEVGHALLASVCEHADPVVKVTIIPRGRALGYVYQVPDEDRFTKTRNDFLANISVLLAGYATEKKYFKDVSTGPSNDLQVATAIARDMVTKYGMSDKAGVMAWEGEGKSEWGGQGVAKDYSGESAKMIDAEVTSILKKQYDFVEKTLKEYEPAHREIAQKLLEAETFDRDEFDMVLKEAGVTIQNRQMRKPLGVKKFKASE